MWTSSQSSTRGQAGLVDDQVAHPEIAVHQPRRRRRRPVRGQPAERPLECRRGVAHLVESVAPLGQLVGAGSGRSRPGRRGGWRPAPARTAAAAGRRPASSRARWIRLTIVSPPIALQIRYGLPSAAGESSAARMCGTGAPAAAAAPAGRRPRVPCRRARRRAGRCAGSGPPALRRPTASNAHVVRLAPPVSARRFSMRRRRRATGREHRLAQLLSLHLRPNPNSRWATRRIWISSAPSVIR